MGIVHLLKQPQCLLKRKNIMGIKLICKYISLFQTLHEHDVELAFFTNELNKTIK